MRTLGDALTVVLDPATPPAVPLATIIHLNVSATNASSSGVWYRFRARELGGDFRIIRDFGPAASLDWTVADHEGAFEMEVSARDLGTGEVATAQTLIQMLPLATSSHPVVSPTSNALVFLYSAPPCPTGLEMYVEFRSQNGQVQQTPLKPCVSGRTMNFYLAGMLPDTTYTARHVVARGIAGPETPGRRARDPRAQSASLLQGPEVGFLAGTPPDGLYLNTVKVSPQSGASDALLLGGPMGTRAVANDVDGKVLWYGPDGLSFLTRAEAGGLFWSVTWNATFGPSQQFIRQFDLSGTTLLETNAGRINEQLQALGKRPITAFHHEARTLPDGKIAALAGVEQLLTDVQGPGTVDVLGDMIIVLDQDLNVVWTWDTFDHLDVHRMAALGETCPGACPPIYLAKKANDWIHGNAIQQTADGDLLFSSRHQDWLIKIAYNWGLGDGHVIWRLGKDGDFQIKSADPYPWFSHQHDGNFESSDPSKLVVFDNSNTRIQVLGGSNSRGQEIQLDEQNRAATLLLDADLGVNSLAVGSAEKLPNGHFHFDAGFVMMQGAFGINAYSMEVSPAGEILYDQVADTILYRSFRMSDMYSPE